MYLLKDIRQLCLLLLLVFVLLVVQFVLECDQHLVVVLDLIILVLRKLFDLPSAQRMHVGLLPLFVEDVLFVLYAQFYRLNFVFNLLLTLSLFFLFNHLLIQTLLQFQLMLLEQPHLALPYHHLLIIIGELVLVERFVDVKHIEYAVVAQFELLGKDTDLR